jgi:hypothetical protein
MASNMLCIKCSYTTLRIVCATVFNQFGKLIAGRHKQKRQELISPCRVMFLNFTASSIHAAPVTEHPLS